MNKLTIVYDVSRLFIGPLFRTPRGIDRIDFLLAKHFAAEPEGVAFYGVMPSLLGIRIYDAARVRRGLQRLENLWIENIDIDDDPRWNYLVARLQGQLDAVAPTRRAFGLFTKARRMAALIGATGISFGRPTSAIPRDAAYLNIGHFSVSVDLFMRWLIERGDVRPVLMLHDVIPLETPEFVAPAAVRFHQRLINSVARYGAGLIVTTNHVRETVTAALARAGAEDMPALSCTLPLAETFDTPAEPDPRLADIPYFVVCGAIERRKNHHLLLNVWRRLAQTTSNPPHLVIVGSPGWRGEAILDSICRCRETAAHIHVVSGLSTPALKTLLAGATALLSPSFAEGFGLPIIEALHLGAPVIASDIPAHREVAGARAVLLDPIDAPAWVREIEARVAHRAKARRDAGSPLAPKAGRDAFVRNIDAFLRRMVDKEQS